MDAQRLHILDILVKRVFLRIAGRRAALATVVEIDELHPLRERREGRLEARVVTARAAVDNEGGRPFGHAGAIRHQAHALHIEIEFGVTDGCVHAAESCYLKPEYMMVRM